MAFLEGERAFLGFGIETAAFLGFICYDFIVTCGPGLRLGLKDQRTRGIDGTRITGLWSRDWSL